MTCRRSHTMPRKCNTSRPEVRRLDESSQIEANEKKLRSADRTDQSNRSLGERSGSMQRREDMGHASGCAETHNAAEEKVGRSPPQDDATGVTEATIARGVRGAKPRRAGCGGCTPTEHYEASPVRAFCVQGSPGERSGRCRIRTYVGFHRQIYSLLPLAARATCRSRIVSRAEQNTSNPHPECKPAGYRPCDATTLGSPGRTDGGWKHRAQLTRRTVRTGAQRG